jgi:CBS domain-containing protein
LISVQVKDVMVRDVAYVKIPGHRDTVLKTLQKRRVSGVPVLKNGRVVGMITRSDLLRNREEDQIALLMTRNPFVVNPDSTVVEASRLLLEHGIRRLPVVEDGSLVGIITVADVVGVAADLEIDVSIEGYFERYVAVLWSEMPLPVAGAVMEHAGVQACPVLDSELKLVGIISDRDLINASVIEDSVVKTDMSAGSEEDTWMWERVMQTTNRYYAVSRIALPEIKVKEAMVPAITAIRSSNVSECASVMRKQQIDQLPVVTSSQKLTGMLTDRDVLRALIEHASYGYSVRATEAVD